MPSFSTDFAFEVFCEKCGAGLCNNCTEGHTKNRGMPFIRVTPCQTCIDNAAEDAREEGYEKGRADAERELAA